MNVCLSNRGLVLQEVLAGVCLLGFALTTAQIAVNRFWSKRLLELQEQRLRYDGSRR